MTVEELREWWLGPHAEIAKGLPGLKKYVISLAVDPPETAKEGPQYDGIAEMWFDNMDDIRKAQTSSVFSELGKDVQEHNVTVVAEIYTEEHDIV
jgi:uncharacterized protein (TIGR02118 family)